MKSILTRISRAKLCIEKFVSVEPVLFLYIFATYAYFTLINQYLIDQYAKELAVPTADEEFNSSLDFTGCLLVEDFDSYTGLNNTFQIVQEKSTTLVIYTIIVNRIMAIVSSIFLGHFSDSFGRKPVFFIVSIGSILQGICGLLVVYAGATFHLLILGAAFAGICGDLSAMLSTSFTYLSDISSTKWRTARLGIAESTIAIGVIASSSTTGIWFNKLGCDFGPPAILYVSCFLGIVVYALIFLPESLKKGERRHKSLRECLRGFQILFGKVGTYKSSIWNIWFALIPIVTTTVAIISTSSIAIFFLKGLNWNPVQIGLYFSIVTASDLIAGVVLLPLMVTIKVPDYAISLIGAILVCLGNVFFALSKETYQVFSIAVLLGMAGLVTPPMRGLLSKVVSKDDKGSLFSVIGSAEVAGSMVSALFLYLLPVISELGVNPGITFIGVALLEAIAVFFLCLSLLGQCYRKCCKCNVVKNSRTLLELKGGDLYYHNDHAEGMAKL